MLVAILLSIAPGIDVDPVGIYAVVLIAVILYAVQALGGLYDVAAMAYREGRA